MPKNTSTKIPKEALVIRTYADFCGEIDAFAHKERNLVIVVGPPGTSKSTAVRKQLKNARVIQGGATPYKLYMDLYENRDLPIVLDDADKVFRNRDGVFLLKLLTQTEKRKTIQWNSRTPEIRRGELESEFVTTSTTLIIANSWPQENADIAAIESRGHLLYFAPSNKEVHEYAGTYFTDKEVYDFIGDHLPLFDALDLRLYHKTQEIKATSKRTGNVDAWRRYVKSHLMDVEKRAALALMSDDSFSTDNQRSKEFARLTGMSPRAFYRFRDEIEIRQGKCGKPQCVSKCQ